MAKDWILKSNVSSAAQGAMADADKSRAQLAIVRGGFWRVLHKPADAPQFVLADRQTMQPVIGRYPSMDVRFRMQSGHDAGHPFTSASGTKRTWRIYLLNLPVSADYFFGDMVGRMAARRGTLILDPREADNLRRAHGRAPVMPSECPSRKSLLRTRRLAHQNWRHSALALRHKLPAAPHHTRAVHLQVRRRYRLTNHDCAAH
jgi:hypothetical protein